jgi:hypothetical protein
MQTVEAMISLMVLVAVVSAMLSGMDGREVDDSLYRVQLAGDAWRVLYLRGDFGEFGEPKRGALEADMQEISDETGMCVFLGGTLFSTPGEAAGGMCRGAGASARETTASLEKTVIWNGTARSLAFTLAR